MLPIGEIKAHIMIALQAAGDPVLGSRLDSICFYLQGWHLAILGQPAFTGEIREIPAGVSITAYGDPVSNREDLNVYPAGNPRPAPLPNDSERLLKAVLAAYACLPPFALHLALNDDPVILEARRCSPFTEGSIIGEDSLRATFAAKDMPEAMASAGFAKIAYTPKPKLAPEPTIEQRTAMARLHVQGIPGGSGGTRYEGAFTVAALLQSKFNLHHPGMQILKEWGERCAPALDPWEIDRCWKAAVEVAAMQRIGAPAEMVTKLKRECMPQTLSV